MVLRKRESRSPPSYFQVEALPARLLGGLFVSLYRVNAALFRRGSGFVLYHANAALFPCVVTLFSRVAALLRRVGDALCFARLGVGPSRRAVLRVAAASTIEDFHKKAERFGYM